jgi:hypothetical protein
MTEAVSFSSSRVSRSRQRAFRELLLDGLAFLAPCFLFLELRVGGRLLFTELVLLAALPVLVYMRGHRLLAREVRRFLILGVLWLIGQILTDLIRGSAFEDLVRGWSKIAFALSNFAALYLIVGDQRRRLLVFALGFVAGLILAFFIAPSDFAIQFPWKFGLGPPVSILALLVASIWPVRLFHIAQVAIALGLGLLNLWMGARMLGGICFLTGCYLGARRFWAPGRGAPKRIKPVRYLMLSTVSIFSIFILYNVYSYMASSGFSVHRPWFVGQR